MDYESSSHRPSWQTAKRPNDVATRQEKPPESSEKLFYARNLKPKSITVVSKDDSSNRTKVILNRRTAMSYEGVLQTVSDILQLTNGPVKDLFTLKGKKVRKCASKH